MNLPKYGDPVLSCAHYLDEKTGNVKHCHVFRVRGGAQRFEIETTCLDKGIGKVEHNIEWCFLCPGCFEKAGIAFGETDVLPKIAPLFTKFWTWKRIVVGGLGS